MSRLYLLCGLVVDQRKPRGVSAVFVAFVPFGGIRRKTGMVRLTGKYPVCLRLLLWARLRMSKEETVFPRGVMQDDWNLFLYHAWETWFLWI